MSGILRGYTDLPEVPAPIVTATEKAAFKVWKKHHGTSSSTILLGMEQIAQKTYMVVVNFDTVWTKLVSADKQKLKLNTVKNISDLCSNTLQNHTDVDNYMSWINQKSKDYYCWVGSSTTLSDAADIDIAITITKISEL